MGAVQAINTSQSQNTINVSWIKPLNFESCNITYNVIVDNKINITQQLFFKIENIVPCKKYNVTVTPMIKNEKGTPTSKTINSISRSKFSKRNTQLLS